MFGTKKPRVINGRVAGVPFDFSTHRTDDICPSCRKPKNSECICGEQAPERDPFEGVQVAAAYAEIVKDLVTHTALTVGGVVAGVAIIRRICR